MKEKHKDNKKQKCDKIKCVHFHKNPDDYVTLICFDCGHYVGDAVNVDFNQNKK